MRHRSGVRSTSRRGDFRPLGPACQDPRTPVLFDLKERLEPDETARQLTSLETVAHARTIARPVHCEGGEDEVSTGDEQVVSALQHGAMQKVDDADEIERALVQRALVQRNLIRIHDARSNRKVLDRRALAKQIKPHWTDVPRLALEATTRELQGVAPDARGEVECSPSADSLEALECPHEERVGCRLAVRASRLVLGVPAFTILVAHARSLLRLAEHRVLDVPFS